MKLISNKEKHILNIDVQFSFIEKSDELVASIINNKIRKYSELEEDDLNEYFEFLDDVDHLIHNLEDDGVLFLITSSPELSTYSGLSEYWKFYFLIDNGSEIDTSYVVDFGLSNHKRRVPKYQQERISKSIKELVLDDNYICIFERIVVNDIIFNNYDEVIQYIENYIINLSESYRK